MSAFGRDTKAKLTAIAAHGEPEEQLRLPFEHLLGDLAELAGVRRETVIAVGETLLSDIKTRPDYAVTKGNHLVGFIELKAPGKGANPTAFRDAHDRDQWLRLTSLPNLLYADGESFSLWRDGKQVGATIRLKGDLYTAGSGLAGGDGLVSLIAEFLQWEPIAPKRPKQLAILTARMCRLLREEVAEHLGRGSPALTALATDWRKLLFPEASDAQFADGYAQAVTFGLLLARAHNIDLDQGIGNAARKLGATNSLIGTALRVLTESAEEHGVLTTSEKTLTRVLSVVDWQAVGKGDPDAWLYFYEDFLAEYDPKLRRRTGSYYTPAEVVDAMVRLTDEALVSRFGLPAGLASPSVTVADPCVGTGTFLLGVLRRIARQVTNDSGEGDVPAKINAAVARLVAFEMQLGPFVVAQVRVLAELLELAQGGLPKSPRMFVTNTLGNPFEEEEWIPGFLKPLADSKKAANKLKRDEKIVVVIGNPPYKEKAKGMGAWVEQGGSGTAAQAAPLLAWIPPADWGVGAHAKHLRNLYVYFWRWATWKVFDRHPTDSSGLVCFITVAGFLAGEGFVRMRDYFRRRCDDVWVIDCSPEGHQPDVPTRIFEDVQQPVCIVMASRSENADDATPARVHFRSLTSGHREAKFEELAGIRLADGGWRECPTGWREPFRPASQGAWATFPDLESLFVYNGSGCMPGRTWVIAPDVDSLRERWRDLVAAPLERKRVDFHPHLRNGEPGDKHVDKVVAKPLPGVAGRTVPVSADSGPCPEILPYGARSFDRQWIIADNRLINQPNPELWTSRSPHQLYLTALDRSSPTGGPAFTISANLPDLDHYKGSFGGRVYPLWLDAGSQFSNIRPALLAHLSTIHGYPTTAPDVVAYLAAVMAHPAFTSRFQSDLSTPGLRVPITANAALYLEAVELGRWIVWLHTFGERYADAAAGRPRQPPRLPKERAPRIPAGGGIPDTPADFPDTIEHDATKGRLLVGKGIIEGVSLAVWNYEVSGKRVLRQWFNNRRKDREKPQIGDRRTPSKLGEIQPAHWLAEYTSELMNVLHVLTWLVELEAKQAELLERICAGPLFTAAAIQEAGAFDLPASYPTSPTKAVDGSGALRLFS